MSLRPRSIDTQTFHDWWQAAVAPESLAVYNSGETHMGSRAGSKVGQHDALDALRAEFQQKRYLHKRKRQQDARQRKALQREHVREAQALRAELQTEFLEVTANMDHSERQLFGLIFDAARKRPALNDLLDRQKSALARFAVERCPTWTEYLQDAVADGTVPPSLLRSPDVKMDSPAPPIVPPLPAKPAPQPPLVRYQDGALPVPPRKAVTPVPQRTDAERRQELIVRLCDRISRSDEPLFHFERTASGDPLRPPPGTPFRFSQSYLSTLSDKARRNAEELASERLVQSAHVRWMALNYEKWLIHTDSQRRELSSSKEQAALASNLAIETGKDDALLHDSSRDHQSSTNYWSSVVASEVSKKERD